MKKNGTVLATMGQIKEIFALLMQAIPSTLTKDAAQKIIGNKSRLIKELQRVLQEIGAVTGYDELLAEWQRFYYEVFGKEVDFWELELPKQKQGFNWLIIMLEGLTPNKLYDKCKERFSSWRYDDDLDAIKSVRAANKTYAVWVRERIEADEENKNKSANDCEGHKGITLEERLLLELFYHWQTGKHLDIENVTLCSGSRYPGGHVPGVFFYGVKVRVYYCLPGLSDVYLRARAVSQ